MHCRFSCSCLLVLVVSLTGCLMGPDYQRPQPDTPIPDAYKEEGPWQLAQSSPVELPADWWSVFGDPVLNGLMQEATTNSPSIRAAFHRVNQARAVARIGMSSFFPMVDLDATGERRRRSGTIGNVPTTVRGRTVTALSVPLSLSYEVDLWGRLRRALESAEAGVEAAEGDWQATVLALQGELATQYFLLRGLDREMELLERTVELRRTNHELLSKRYQAGDIDALDVQRGETELAAAESDRLGLSRQRDELESGIAVLVGRYASGFDLPFAVLDGAPPRIPRSLPSVLLERRPDVFAAERRMAEENARIGMAQAAFYPAIQLVGSAGVESSSIGDLFSWPSRTWGVGPRVSLPFLNGGRLNSEKKQAEARYLERVEEYRALILNALREADDSLTHLKWLALQSEAQDRTVTSARRVFELSQKRYEAGLVSYFDVVEAHRTLLQHERLAAQIQSLRFVSTVTLVRATGGGWGEGVAPESTGGAE